jgi:putative transposase
MVAHPFAIDAMVVLPDHLHTIWTLPEGDSDFSSRWKMVKGAFSRRYSEDRTGDISESMCQKHEKGIWQRRFWEHAIRDEEDFNRHCDYIHYNPVKHRLVSSPVEWKYSSFGDLVKKGIYPSNWGHNQGKKLAEMDFE